MLSSNSVLRPPPLLPCICMFNIFLVSSRVAMLSQSSLSEEGCHWFDVAFSTDVFILDVVLLGLASGQSRHSHLSGVPFLCIVFLGCPPFRPVYHHYWLDYGLVDLIFDLHMHLFYCTTPLSIYLMLPSLSCSHPSLILARYLNTFTVRLLVLCSLLDM